MNEYNKLKEIIVGEEYFNIPYFKNFDFNDFFKTNHFLIKDTKKILERNMDITNLKKILRNNNVNVIDNVYKKDEKLDFIIGSNARDILLFLNKLVLICEPYISERSEEYKNYQLPKTHSVINTKDLYKEFKHLPKDKYTYKVENTDVDFFKTDYKKYYPCIEAANFMKFKDNVLVVNISNHSEYHAIQILKEVLKDYKIIIVFIDYNHIDGTLVQINKDLYLTSSYLSQSELLKRISILGITKNNIIYIPKSDNANKYDLASEEGMDINILMLNPNTCIIRNTNKYLINELNKRSINTIEVRLRHCEYFGGGLHCITSDIKRK